MAQENVERLRYYQRQYLGAQDFEDEQTYQRDMRRRHNLAHHRWGIVTGLEIIEDATGGIWVQPGMAVDGYGREVVVFAPYALATTNFQDTQYHTVWLQYWEVMASNVQDGYEPCVADGQYNRIGETFQILIDPLSTNSPITIDGNTRVADIEQSIPFQEFADPLARWLIPLGRFIWDGKHFTPSADGRRYIGSVASEIVASAGQLVVRGPVLNTTDGPHGGAASTVSMIVDGELHVKHVLSVENDIQLQGSALDFCDAVDSSGSHTGTASQANLFSIARVQQRLGKDVRVQIGKENKGNNRFVVGADTADLFAITDQGNAQLMGSLKVEQDVLLGGNISLGGQNLFDVETNTSGGTDVHFRLGQRSQGNNHFIVGTDKVDLLTVADNGDVSVGGRLQLAYALSVPGLLNLDEKNQLAIGAIPANTTSEPQRVGGEDLVAQIGAGNSGKNRFVVGTRLGPQLTVTDDGHTHILGTLAVDGNTSIEGTLAVQSLSTAGSLSLKGDLAVGGSSTTIRDMRVSGTASFEQDVTVGGRLRVQHDLAVDGVLNVLHDLTVEGMLNARHDLTVEGMLNVQHDLVVGGPLSARNGLSVEGSLNARDLSVAGPLRVEQDLTVNGPVRAMRDLAVAGPLRVEQDLSVAGPARIMRDLMVEGPLRVGQDLSVAGPFSAEGNVAIRGPLEVKGELTTDSTLAFTIPSQQMINLSNTDYGIGVQNSTLYQRSDADFCWFRGGRHSDARNDAGGGMLQMRLGGEGALEVTSRDKNGHLSYTYIDPGQQTSSVEIGRARGQFFGDNVYGIPNLWLDATNTVYLKKGYQTNAMDGAEFFTFQEPVSSGDVVVLAPIGQRMVQLARSAHDPAVVGVISTDPAFILGGAASADEIEAINESRVPVALIGTVPCKVDADIAPIHIGDLLTTSPTPGHAQKVVEGAMGAVLGKAMGNLESGKGLVQIVVMLS